MSSVCNSVLSGGLVVRAGCKNREFPSSLGGKHRGFSPELAVSSRIVRGLVLHCSAVCEVPPETARELFGGLARWNDNYLYLMASMDLRADAWSTVLDRNGTPLQRKGSSFLGRIRFQ